MPYAVLKGERGYGGILLGLYESYERAEKFALSRETCFPGGWKKETEGVWVNGCDFVKIQLHTVIK